MKTHRVISLVHGRDKWQYLIQINEDTFLPAGKTLPTHSEIHKTVDEAGKLIGLRFSYDINCFSPEGLFQTWKEESPISE